MIKEQVQFQLSVQVAIMAQGNAVPMVLILRRIPQLRKTPVPDVAGRSAPAYKRKTGEHVTVTIDQKRIVTSPAKNWRWKAGEGGTEEPQMSRRVLDAEAILRSFSDMSNHLVNLVQ